MVNIRHPDFQVAGILKEIEVLPLFLGRIVGFDLFTASGAMKNTALGKIDMNIDRTGFFVKIDPRNFPWWFQF